MGLETKQNKTKLGQPHHEPNTVQTPSKLPGFKNSLAPPWAANVFHFFI